MKKRIFKPSEVTVLNNKPIDIPIDEEQEEKRGKKIFSPDEVTVTSEPETEGLGAKGYKQVAKEIWRDIPKAAKSVPFGAGEEIRAFSDVLGPEGMTTLAKTGEFDSLIKLYRKKRNEYTQLSDEAFRDSYGTSVVVNLLGDMGFSLGAGAAYKGAGKFINAMGKGKISSTLKGAKKAIDFVRPHSRGAQTAAIGAIEGVGHSKGDLTKGEYGKVGLDALIGSGASLATETGIGLFKRIGARPTEKHARILGARTKDFERKGLGNAQKTAQDLYQSGIFEGDAFKNPNIEFDINTQKFTINNKLSHEAIKAKQDFLKNANHPEVIQKHLNGIIEKNSESINIGIDLIDELSGMSDSKGKTASKLILYKVISKMDKLKEETLKTLKEKAKKGISKTAESNQIELDEITKRFDRVVKESFYSGKPASSLQETKKAIQGELADEYKGTEKRNEFLISYRKKLATLLKNSINDLADGFFPERNFSKKNNLMHEAFNAKDMIEPKISALMTGSDPSSYYHGNQIGYAQKVYDKVMRSDPMNRFRGNVGHAASDYVGKPTGKVYEAFSNKLRLNELIPANTTSFFNYRNIIYSKLATMNPFMADLIRRNALDVDKRTSEAFFKQNGPLLLQMLKPTGMIESDEFDSFDGVPSEEGRYKFLEKINDDPDMNVFEQTEKIDRFNRQGTIANIVPREETNPLELLLNG